MFFELMPRLNVLGSSQAVPAARGSCVRPASSSAVGWAGTGTRPRTRTDPSPESPVLSRPTTSGTRGTHSHENSVAKPRGCQNRLGVWPFRRHAGSR